MNSLSNKIRRKIEGITFKLPGMITCETFEKFIVAYLEDELPAGQRRLFETHLKVCRSCKRYLASYRKMLAATEGLAESDFSELKDVPEDLIAAILAAQAPENS